MSSFYTNKHSLPLPPNIHPGQAVRIGTQKKN
uniref:Uncharacterized protein n=1 Tax=Anguilla anguilla TaxID=7936 RepID=A0A0E9W8W2_ANGAN